MSNPQIHGNRAVFSASSVLDAISKALVEIKAADRLTYADLGAVLGKSEDQAAKYCDGSATMDAVTFGRAKREWNGRFTGYFDRLCVESRPAFGSDRHASNAILSAAVSMCRALEDDDVIDKNEVLSSRPELEAARDAIEAQLRKLMPAEVRA